VTDVSRLLRGALPLLVALPVATAFALPANAARPAPAAQPTRAAQWWLTALHVPGAWRAAPREGNGVTVAVLSTGVAAAHRDLAGAVAAGPDYSASGRIAGGPFWGFEGTAVASLIAGHGHGAGGATGITGIAPRARVLSVRVTLEYNDPLNSAAAVTRRLPAAIAAGIRYAVARGAAVIALPLDPGTLGPVASGDPAAAGGSAAERAAVSYALGRGVVLVAPAGDNGAGTGTVNYPAAYPGVIAVGATVRNGGLAPYTSTRSYVALTAPGSGLITAAPGGGYDSLASTDMSSALTAGVAALIRARFPRLTPAEVTQALERGTAAKPGAPAARGAGHGALDAAGAVTAAAAIAAAHPAPSPQASSAGSAPPATHRAIAPQPAGFGGLAGTVLRDAVLAACALIAALAAALAVSAARRRRALNAARSPQLQRTGQGGSHARRPGTALAALPAGSRDQARPRGPRGGTRGNGDSAGARIVPMSAVLMPRTGRTRGRHKATGEPPWEPASRPPTPLPAVSRTALPGARAALPAGGGQAWAGPDEQVPPWELAPAEFAASPLTTDFPDWSPSSTGPMYVWNPAASGPLPAVPRDPADEDQARDLSERARGASPALTRLRRRAWPSRRTRTRARSPGRTAP
jgi:subtilisin family serine protease